MASATRFIRNTLMRPFQSYFGTSGVALPAPLDWETPEFKVGRAFFQAVDDMNDETRSGDLEDAECIGAMSDDAMYSVIEDRAVLGGLTKRFWFRLDRGPESLWLWLPIRLASLPVPPLPTPRGPLPSPPCTRGLGGHGDRLAEGF